MANKILEKTLNNVDKNDMQPGFASPQVGADGGPIYPADSSTETMSTTGSARAALVLLLILGATGAWAWIQVPESSVGGYLIIALLVGFGLGMFTAFKPASARISAPLYAAAQGVVLGLISRLYEDLYDGIVIQAVLATASIAFVMYTLYSTRILKVTEKFRKVVIGATLGIFVFYMLNFVLSIFGVNMPLINDTGIMGIGFSLFVISIGASNLALDFDFIERGSEAGLPKYMNWAAGFGLVATLIWIYLEVLRLLSKIRN